MNVIDSNRNLIEGSNESIVCDAVGNPEPNIYWKIDGNIFPSDKFERFDYNSLKRIDKAVDDQLNLTCVAENQFGIDIRTVSIKLIGKIKLKMTN